LSRGEKLELGIGAKFEDEWSFVEEQKDAQRKLLPPKKHLLVFKKEKRRGKVVTLLGEFFLDQKEAKKLLKELKSSLACGGSFKDGFFEFQGEKQEQLRVLVKEKGFGVKN